MPFGGGDEECRHGMNPAWCGHCLKILDTEQEQKQLDGDWNLTDAAEIGDKTDGNDSKN